MSNGHCQPWTTFSIHIYLIQENSCLSKRSIYYVINENESRKVTRKINKYCNCLGNVLGNMSTICLTTPYSPLLKQGCSY